MVNQASEAIPLRQTQEVKGSAYPRTKPDHPLPPHLEKIAASSATDLMKTLHGLALRERLAFQRTIDPQRAEAAIQAGNNIAQLLETDPPKSGETTEAKHMRLQHVTEYLADPTATAFASKLYENLLPTFQQMGIREPALILVGSASTGGMHLRTLAGTSGKTMDLDMALVFTPQGTIDFNAAQDAVTKQMQEMQQGKDQAFVPCKRANIRNHHQERFTQETVAGKLNAPLSHIEATAVVNCFFPSIPPRVNIDQQTVILDYLSSLAKTNPDLWKTQIREIFKRWEGLYFVKAKYLTESQDDFNAEITNMRTQEELNAAQDRSQEIKSQLFRDLLLSTAQ